MTDDEVPFTLTLVLSHAPKVGETATLTATVTAVPRLPPRPCAVSAILPAGIERAAGPERVEDTLAPNRPLVLQNTIVVRTPGLYTLEAQVTCEEGGMTVYALNQQLYLDTSQENATISDTLLGAQPVEVTPALEPGPPGPYLGTPSSTTPGRKDEAASPPRSPASTGGTVTVFGYWYYRDVSGVDRPVPYGMVEIWDTENSIFGDIKLTTIFTNPEGYYEASLPNDDVFNNGLDIFVKILSTDNDSVRVTNFSDSLYQYRTPTTTNVQDGNFNAGSWAMTDANRATFYMVDIIGHDAYHYLANNVSWYNHYNVQVRWTSTNTTDGTHEHPDGPIDMLANDGWDEDVLLHEFGHFVMEKLYTTYPSTPNCNPHYWQLPSSNGCAWSEGWAQFIQGAIQGHPQKINSGSVANMETNTPFSSGPDVEGAVAASLWDIFDSVDEPRDILDGGIVSIWNIVRDTNPDDVFEFYNSWLSANSIYRCQVSDIMRHHGINVTANAVVINGYVRTSAGTGVSGVTMNGLPGNPVTNASGFYVETPTCPWTGTVTPQKTGYAFSPVSRTYTQLTGGMLNQDYTALPCRTVLASANPVGKGSVSISPAPNCTSTLYKEGTVLTLRATPIAGWRFDHWSGSVSGTTNPVTLTVTGTTGVTANFEQICYTLTTTVNPLGRGFIGISPSANCSGGRYLPGTVVTLTAWAASGSSFGFWNGSVSGVTNPLSVTMSADRTMIGNYGPVVGNNDFNSAWIVPAVPYTHMQEMTGATSATDDPSFSCGYAFSGRGYQTMWYRYTATFTGNLAANTFGSSYDTILAVWTGTRGALVNRGCNDDYTNLQSRVIFPVTAGTTYYIEVLSYSLSIGTMMLTIETGPTTAPALLAPGNGSTIPRDVLFSWGTVAAATSYQIQLDDDSLFGSPEVNVTLAGTSYSAAGLYDGVRYYWRVRGQNDIAPGPWSAVYSALVDVAPPPVPVLSAPANQSNTPNMTPTLTWLAAAGATGYRVEVSSSPAFSTLAASYDGPAVTSFTTPPLSYGTYYWRVRSRDNVPNNSAWSTVYRFTVTLLRAPANGSYTTSTRPVLSWYAVPRQSYTLVMVRIVSGVPTALPPVILPPTTLSYTPTLLPGEYDWHIEVAGQVTPSWRFTVTPTIPPAPAATAPTTGLQTNDNTPTFTWNPLTAPEGAPYTYQIQVDNLSTFRSPEVDSEVNALAYTALPLADGLYYWRVRAINQYDTAGLWSAVRTLTVDTTPPPAPTLLTPPDQSGTTLPSQRLTWSLVSGARSYEVQISPDAIFDLSDPIYPTAANSLLRTLSYGTIYWRVHAIDAVGNQGPWSIPFRIFISSAPLVLPAQPVLTGPANGGVTNAPNPLSLTWNVAANAASYRLQVDDDSLFRSPAADVTAGLGASVSLGADARYYWRVRGININGVGGSWSAVWSFTLDRTAPAAPALTAPANGTGTASLRPTFIWTIPAGTNWYRVQLSRNSAFTDVIVTQEQATASFIPAVNLSGSVYWHVMARDAAGNWSPWSSASSVTITLLRSPVNNSYTLSQRPTFMWYAESRASSYSLQVDTESSFAPPLSLDVIFRSGTTTYAIPLTARMLPYGQYWWRLCANVGGTCVWSVPWTFTVTPAPPVAPRLRGPLNGAITNSPAPTFEWYAVLGASIYGIQIDTVTTFSSPDWDTLSADLNFTPAGLPNGVYYWRMRSVNGWGVPGAWSTPWRLTIQAALPAAPVVTFPAPGALVTNPQLLFGWNAVPGATAYEFQIDSVSPPAEPPIRLGAVISYRLPGTLMRGIYYWRVRALDAAGNVGPWSALRSFEIVAGYTMGGAETPTPTPDTLATEASTAAPTEAATEVPTVEPTALPTATAVPETVLLRVESDDEAVIQAGAWTAHDTAAASGGRYLFSSGSPDDRLTLAFSGTTLGVIVIQHPALGSFVMEVDGAALQIVSTTANEAIFGTEVKVTGLTAGPHTLRILPASGTIAIDAFEVEAVLAPPATLTPEPTEPPATPEVPTAVPTEPPLPTPEPPTAIPLPLPVLLPVVETFDSGQGWTAGGAWRWDTLSAHSGAGWFADSTARAQVSTLTFRTPLDLRAALAPQVIFWQQSALTSGDLFAVDLSLDGGLSWLVVDTQTALVTAWTPRTLDLSPYRGLIVMLRFRLDTMGAPAEGETTFGVALDDLLIQEAPPLPTAIPTEPPLPTEVPVPTAVPTDLPTELPPTEVPTEVPLEAATEAPLPPGTEVLAP